MLDLIALLLGLIPAALRHRRDLVLETLLLRHQLAVVLRPKPRPRLRTRDRLLWVLGRRFCPDWRQHPALVTPDTAVRWAPARMAPVLALSGALLRWTAPRRPRDAGADPVDVARQRPVGHRADPRRAARARDRGQ